MFRAAHSPQRIGSFRAATNQIIRVKITPENATSATFDGVIIKTVVGRLAVGYIIITFR